MPGLFGIISATPQATLEENLLQMKQSMMHEEFYRADIFLDPERRWGVGWVNLPETFSDCMPVWNEDRSLILFFHGEHFGGGCERDGLKDHHDIDGRNDARRLIHFFEERGEAFLPELNGFFHGVLVDLRRRRTILFNDRFGMQRLYCHEGGGLFQFASGTGALLRINPRLREIVPEQLGEFLSMQCVLENRTLYKDVQLLPAASVWEFRDGRPGQRRQYFQSADWEGQPELDREPFYQQLKGAYREILPAYFDGKQPAGLSLTGGLDSRLVLAGRNPVPGTLPCHTFASVYNDSVDVKLAREVARRSGQQHSVIRIGDEFIEEFPKLASKAVQVSGGNVDAASGAVELYANRAVRAVAPVRLTGNYGSEVLRGVRAFRHRVPQTTIFTPDLIKHCENAREIFLGQLAGRALTFAAFRQAAWFNGNRRSLEQSQLDTRTPFMDNRILACAYRAPANAVSNDAIFQRLLRELSPALAGVGTNRGAAGERGRLASRALGAWRELCHKAEHGYDYNLPNLGARFDLLLKPLRLQRIFLGREKFYFFRIWYRDVLGNYLRETLLDHRSLEAPFINRKQVESMVIAHTSGRENHTKAITMLLTYVLTRRLLQG